MKRPFRRWLAAASIMSALISPEAKAQTSGFIEDTALIEIEALRALKNSSLARTQAPGLLTAPSGVVAVAIRAYRSLEAATPVAARLRSEVQLEGLSLTLSTSPCRTKRNTVEQARCVLETAQFLLQAGGVTMRGDTAIVATSLYTRDSDSKVGYLVWNAGVWLVREGTDWRPSGVYPVRM
jgi:hypothetical protein